MWNNFIGSQIRRSSRNLLIVNAVLVTILLLILGSSRRYLYNVFAGPFPMTTDEIASIRNPAALNRYYVSVHGAQSKPAGLTVMDQRVNKYSRKVQSESLSAAYFAMPARPRMLLIKSSTTMAASDYTGALVTPEASVRTWYDTELKSRRLTFDDVFLPTVLDATSFRTGAYWELAISVPLLFLGIFNLGKGVMRAADFRNSPIAKALAPFGPPEQVAMGMQSEIAQWGNRSTLKHTVLLASWLLRDSFYGLKVIHLNDVIWVYQKVTKHTTNAVPTGTTFGVIVGDRNGKRLECAGRQADVIKLIEALAGSVPWIMIGYSAELNTLFAQKPAEFATFVQQRRDEFFRARAAQ